MYVYKLFLLMVCCLV